MSEFLDIWQYNHELLKMDIKTQRQALSKDWAKFAALTNQDPQAIQDKFDR